MPKRSVFLSMLFGLAFATAALAQSGVPSADRIIRFNGSVAGASAGAQTLRFAVYDEETGGNLLWEEVQTAAVDAAGNFTVFLGGTSTDGLPVALFANGAPRWLSVEQAGIAAGPRVLLAAVPYAVSAANATSLGGRPATDYLLTPQARAAAAAAAGTSGAAAADREPLPLVNNGTANFIGKFFNNVDLINSQIFDNGTNVGVGTTNPFDKFHVQFTNTAGSLTGYAVQNLGSTAASYSGMLFYDHTGALRQFQGYSNGTGEYRINNISPSGSINFMTGTSKFKVASGSGYIGLNAEGLTPSTRIHLFGAVVGTDDYTIRSSRAAGSLASPTAVVSGSSLLRLEGSGHTGSAYTPDRALIRMFTTENWSTTANGTAISFSTTANTTSFASVRMTISDSGNVGIGTQAPDTPLEVVGNIRATSGDFQPLDTSSFGVRWVNTSGTIRAHIHRFSVDDRLYVTNAGSANLTGLYLASGATSWTSTSDERLKRNITPLSGLLGKIKGIRVASYDMAGVSAGADGPKVDMANTHHEVGSIAQDWLKDFPDLVVTPKTADQFYGLNYERIGVVALGAVQELNAVVEQKDAEIKSLNDRIAALEAAIKSLTTAVQQQR